VHARTTETRSRAPRIAVNQAKAGQNFMPATTETLQHRAGFRTRLWFAEDPFPEDNDGVDADDQSRSVPRSHFRRFHASHPHRIIRGCLACVAHRFRYPAGLDAELKAKLF
jgi:hypothetical protein